MYSRGIRPLQKVIYLTDQIRSVIEWRGYSLSDLFTFSSISQALGDDQIVNLVLLNSGTNDMDVYLPYSVGNETILSMWQREVSTLDDDSLKDRLRNVQDLLLVKRNSALKDVLEYPLKDTPYVIEHDENCIHVILQLDTMSTESLLNSKIIGKLLPRDIIKTYGIYYPFNIVASSPWFRSYIDQL